MSCEVKLNGHDRIYSKCKCGKFYFNTFPIKVM